MKITVWEKKKKWGKKYRYHFGGIRGFLKFLYEKKICQQCGSKLKRKTEKTPVTSHEQDINIYYVTILYECEKCGIIISPRDL